ncbi:MAG: AAA family ATPase [Acidimicrobiales bacterium]
MRPVRLELKGFATFRDHTVVDFGDADLLAFVGPTGAGKSTIIDGIGFALYGSVSRYRKTNIVAPVINQLSAEARVRLDFTVDDVEYSAVRVVRRTKTGATTKEARLESGTQVLAGSAGELDARVEELLGLTFEQFTKTVVLPQGDFARFLTESSGDRQALLRRLLGMTVFRSMGSAARDLAKRADAGVEALTDHGIPAIDDELVAKRATRLDELVAVAPAISELNEVVKEATATSESANASQLAASTRLAALALVVVPVDAGGLAEEIERAQAAIDDAVDNFAAARSAETQLSERLDATADPTALEQIEKAYTLREQRIDDVAELAEYLVVHQGAVATARESADKAELILTEAIESRTRAQLHAGATGIAATLVEGEACPVCDQLVMSLPSHQTNADLRDVEKAVADATRARELAAKTHARATRAEVETNTSLANAQDQLSSLDDVLTDAPEKSELATLIESSVAARAAHEAARAEVNKAHDRQSQAEAARRALEERERELAAGYASVRDGVAALDPPVPGLRSVIADWTELATWARRHEASHQAELDVASRALERAQADELEARISLQNALAPFTDDDRTDPQAWLVAEIARAQAEVERDRTDIERRAEALERVESMKAEGRVAAELGRLLGSSGFEQWLMTDVLRDLADRASTRLLELSDGAFELISDGAEFSIVDHRNADEIRPARTLSGGETFIASLALALALSENIAELATDGAPRIESMFLDEGFGTLDPETLDTVAAAIEELGASGMMVGIVTHIRDLADRVPTRFEVTRTPTTSIVTRVHQ